MCTSRSSTTRGQIEGKNCDKADYSELPGETINQNIAPIYMKDMEFQTMTQKVDADLATGGLQIINVNTFPDIQLQGFRHRYHWLGVHIFNISHSFKSLFELCLLSTDDVTNQKISSAPTDNEGLKQDVKQNATGQTVEMEAEEKDTARATDKVQPEDTALAANTAAQTAETGARDWGNFLSSTRATDREAVMTGMSVGMRLLQTLISLRSWNAGGTLPTANDFANSVLDPIEWPNGTACNATTFQ
jgi:hypothetical protein